MMTNEELLAGRTQGELAAQAFGRILLMQSVKWGVILLVTRQVRKMAEK